MSYFFHIFQKKILSEKNFLDNGSKKSKQQTQRKQKVAHNCAKEIISAYERGDRIVDLAAKHGVASIATILEEEIKAASAAAGMKTLVSQSQSSSVNEETEKLLMICSKASMIYENLKKNVAGHSTAEAEEKFKASRGWFEKFKRRSRIHSVIRHGGFSAYKEAERFAKEFQERTIIHGYKPELMFVTKLDCSGSKCPKELSSQKKRSVCQGTNL
jgi:hypothetical protein